MTLTDFINEPKSLLIAAAGHGKTHAIAECVQLCPEGQCQLILTHTHAGIASIKAKLNALKVDSKKYHVETITSFVQQYTMAYCKKEDLPEPSDKTYFRIVQEKALKIFSNPHILGVVKVTYGSLFVDEYQDCEEIQHAIIMKLGQVLPVHVLGDELQGIFGFVGRLVNFEQDLQEFKQFELKKPWRWCKEGNSQALGDKILEWRKKLLAKERIRLVTDRDANVEVCIVAFEAMSHSRYYYQLLRKVITMYDSESMLIIFPSYVDERGFLRGRINDRISIKDGFDFENRFLLAEAIDDRSFYFNAKAIDEIIRKINSPRVKKKEKKIVDMMNALSFNRTDLYIWFDRKHDCRLIDKKKGNKAKSDKLAEIYGRFLTNPSKRGLDEIITFFQKDAGMKPKRCEVLSSIQHCLRSYPEEMSVYDAMYETRNAIRRGGRKIQGRCIGTTLLTKGLEFDTVIVLDAHRFEDAKNFYVAISRACKHLVIISKESVLQFER